MTDVTQACADVPKESTNAR